MQLQGGGVDDYCKYVVTGVQLQGGGVDDYCKYVVTGVHLQGGGVDNYCKYVVTGVQLQGGGVDLSAQSHALSPCGIILTRTSFQALFDIYHHSKSCVILSWRLILTIKIEFK